MIYAQMLYRASATLPAKLWICMLQSAPWMEMVSPTQVKEGLLRFHSRLTETACAHVSSITHANMPPSGIC